MFIYADSHPMILIVWQFNMSQWNHLTHLDYIKYIRTYHILMRRHTQLDSLMDATSNDTERSMGHNDSLKNVSFLLKTFVPYQNILSLYAQEFESKYHCLSLKCIKFERSMARNNFQKGSWCIFSCYPVKFILCFMFWSPVVLYRCWLLQSLLLSLNSNSWLALWIISESRARWEVNVCLCWG